MLEPIKLFETVTHACQEIKGENILGLDLSLIESYADYVLIVSGNNERQIQSLADRILQKTYKEHTRHPLGVEGMQISQWILIDYGDVVCHVFSEEARDIYHLEDMWPHITPLDEAGIEALVLSSQGQKKAKKISN